MNTEKHQLDHTDYCKPSESLTKRLNTTTRDQIFSLNTCNSMLNRSLFKIKISFLSYRSNVLWNFVQIIGISNKKKEHENMELFLLLELILNNKSKVNYMLLNILLHVNVIGVATILLGERKILKNPIRKMSFHLNLLATIHQLYYYKYKCTNFQGDW